MGFRGNPKGKHQFGGFPRPKWTNQESATVSHLLATLREVVATTILGGCISSKSLIFGCLWSESEVSGFEYRMQLSRSTLVDRNDEASTCLLYTNLVTALSRSSFSKQLQHPCLSAPHTRCSSRPQSHSLRCSWGRTQYFPGKFNFSWACHKQLLTAPSSHTSLH